MTSVTPPRRRRASQSRSRATVQRILEATTALIAEKGAQGVTMSEIAKRADLVIGSLYQYFTDKSAIFREILIRHQAEARALLHHFLAEVRTLEELTDALVRSFDAYFEILQRDRLIVGLWSIVQTDPDLQALDLEDTLQNARHVASVASRHLPGVDPNRIVATSVMLIQFALYAGRLARDLPPDMAADVPTISRVMIRSTLLSLQTTTDGT